MKLVIFAVALLQGAMLVGILALIQAIVHAFAPAWQMPFSPWWGMLFAIPGLLMGHAFNRS